MVNLLTLQPLEFAFTVFHKESILCDICFDFKAHYSWSKNLCRSRCGMIKFLPFSMAVGTKHNELKFCNEWVFLYEKKNNMQWINTSIHCFVDVECYRTCEHLWPWMRTWRSRNRTSRPTVRRRWPGWRPGLRSWRRALRTRTPRTRWVRRTRRVHVYLSVGGSGMEGGYKMIWQWTVVYGRMVHQYLCRLPPLA